ncbi:hypothetical protein IID04_03505 [PVC group bacterium]|nr:hypothetical protein [PVC group bacterium]
MIPVEDLTEVQRQFLEEEYGLDLEKRVSSARQYNRRQMKFCLIFPLLAIALYWEGTSDVMASSFKPFGIISWCVFGILFFVEVAGWTHFWIGTRSAPLVNTLSDSNPHRNTWRTLLVLYIGIKTPLYLVPLWIVGPVMLILAAWATNRPVLALAWLALAAIYYSLRIWSNRKVFHALEETI